MADTSDDSGTAGQQPQCPLLSLPPELRNQIYELAIIRMGQYCIDGWWVDRPVQPALTRTCRAVRAEGLPIFYGSNIFTIHIAYDKGEKLVQARLTAIGSSNREHLQQVCVGREGYRLYFPAIEGLRRARSSFLERLQHSGEETFKGRRFYIVKLDSLTFDD